MKKKHIILLMIISITLLAVSYAFIQLNKKSSSNYNVVKFDQLDDIKNEYEYFILYIKQKGCISCEQVEPIINNLIKDNQIKIMSIFGDDAENKGVYESLDVSVTPTIIFFQNGLEIDRIVGLFSEESLLKKMDVLYSNYIHSNKSKKT